MILPAPCRPPHRCLPHLPLPIRILRRAQAAMSAPPSAFPRKGMARPHSGRAQSAPHTPARHRSPLPAAPPYRRETRISGKDPQCLPQRSLQTAPPDTPPARDGTSRAGTAPESGLAAPHPRRRGRNNPRTRQTPDPSPRIAAPAPP